MKRRLARLAFVATCLMSALAAQAADAPGTLNPPTNVDTPPPPPPNTVPEPGSIALVALALGTSLLAAQRRRRVARRPH